jgi:hypothetical protein
MLESETGVQARASNTKPLTNAGPPQEKRGRRKTSIILFELNEVPFRVIDDYCARFPQSTLAGLLKVSQQYETTADDSILSPWITWPTVHRGVSSEQHGINHLGQELGSADEKYPPVWKILAANGLKPAVFGSLHTYPLPSEVDRYSFYVPDTFAAGPETSPPALSLFQNFNLSMARQSPRNVSSSVPWRDALHLMREARNLGLRVRTLLRCGSQVAVERFKPWRRNRRRSYQAVLSFDVFMKQLEEYRPSFATFFTNHVASAMHRYWAAAFPSDYPSSGYDPRWVSQYREEITFSMMLFDRMLARLRTFVDRNDGYTLWIASSMGQAATIAEPLRTQLYVADLPAFMSRMGLSPDDWSQRPAMAPDVSVLVRQEKVPAFRALLGQLFIDGKPIEWHERSDGFFSLSLGHPNLPPTAQATLGGKAMTMRDLGLDNYKIEDSSNSNAYHIPQGALILYDPREPATKTARVSLSSREIAPAILETFGLLPPPYMVASRLLRIH